MDGLCVRMPAMYTAATEHGPSTSAVRILMTM